MLFYFEMEYLQSLLLALSIQSLVQGPFTDAVFLKAVTDDVMMMSFTTPVFLLLLLLLLSLGRTSRDLKVLNCFGNCSCL